MGFRGEQYELALLCDDIVEKCLKSTHIAGHKNNSNHI